MGRGGKCGDKETAPVRDPQARGVTPGQGVCGETLGRGKRFGSDWRLRIPLGGASHPQPPGAGSCGRAPGAPTRGLLPQTSAASTQNSPRRRTHGSGCPGGESRGLRDVESWPLITPKLSGPEPGHPPGPGHALCCQALSPYSSRCRPLPEESDTPTAPQQSPTPRSWDSLPTAGPASRPRPTPLTTSRSACRLASSGPRGPRSGEAGSGLPAVPARPGVCDSSASGMGSAWEGPRPALTVLMTARTDGRRCRGGVSATGEGRRCSSSCVALRRDMGKQPGSVGVIGQGTKLGLKLRHCGQLSQTWDREKSEVRGRGTSLWRETEAQGRRNRGPELE